MRLRNIPGARETIAESQWIVQDPSSCKGKWRERFGNDHPVHLEIGTGKGKSELWTSWMSPRRRTFSL